jgi:hypothetical protein
MHFVGRADLLDEHGGSDIVQVPPRMITFDGGNEHIVGMRLSNKGMYRWYANCCKTPLGNTMKPAVPFIGLALEVFRGAPIDAIFGKPRGLVMGKFAIGGAPEGSTGFPLRLFARGVAKILGWKFSGMSWPHPYFDKGAQRPKYPVTVLQPEERDALRSKCGPRPAVSARDIR